MVDPNSSSSSSSKLHGMMTSLLPATFVMPKMMCKMSSMLSSNVHISRCAHPQINRMNVNRHHQALSICGEALSKGDSGPFKVYK
eukprot:792242-Pelagomonas_calceolata.AAC.1